MKCATNSNRKDSSETWRRLKQRESTVLQTMGELAKTGSPPQISSATFPAASFTSAFKILEQSMPATIAHGLGGSNARGTGRWALVPRRSGDPRRADRPGGAPIAAAPTRPPAAKMPPPHASACDSATGSRDQDGGGTDGGRHHPTPPRPRLPVAGRPAGRHHGAAGAPVHGRGAGAWRRSAVHAKRGASVPRYRRSSRPLVAATAVEQHDAGGRRSGAHGQPPSPLPAVAMAAPGEARAAAVARGGGHYPPPPPPPLPYMRMLAVKPKEGIPYANRRQKCASQAVALDGLVSGDSQNGAAPARAVSASALLPPLRSSASTSRGTVCSMVVGTIGTAARHGSPSR